MTTDYYLRVNLPTAGSLIYICVCMLILLIFAGIAGASQDLLKLDSVSDLYVVWSEFDGNDNEIYISRRSAGKWNEKERITDNDTDDFSPCIALDKNSYPWIVWVGDDGVNTAIYSCYWNGKLWSKIYQVDNVDLYEDTLPSITFDEENVPWVVWCGTDSRDDDIYISSWNGYSWGYEKIVNTDDNWPDLTPAITSFPGRKELFIVWMGFNGSDYELYYTSYKQKRVSEEECFSFKKIGAFGKFPSFLKYSDGNIRLFWIENGNYFSILGDGINWESKESIDLAYTDKFLVDLLDKFDAPVWIAWMNGGVRQNFRLIPMHTQQKVLTEKMYFKKVILGYIIYFLDSKAYANSEATKYIAYGDSITHGKQFEGYPIKLERKLNTNIGPSTVVNEGVCGEDTPTGAKRIASVLQKHNAQHLLLQEGTNDITGGFSLTSIKFNLGQMIDICKVYNTIPLLSYLTPRLDSLDDRTRQCNYDFIKPLSEEKSVLLVDNYMPLYENKERYFYDEKHPNDEGYEVMAQTWFSAISDILNTEEDDDNSGCGAVTLPATKSGDKGINFEILVIIFILIFYLRYRLCRS